MPRLTRELAHQRSAIVREAIRRAGMDGLVRRAIERETRLTGNAVEVALTRLHADGSIARIREVVAGRISARWVYVGEGTDATPDTVSADILAALSDPARRADALTRDEIIRAVTTAPAAQVAARLKALVKSGKVVHERSANEAGAVVEVYRVPRQPGRARTPQHLAPAPAGCLDPHCACPMRPSDFQTVDGHLLRTHCRRDDCDGDVVIEEDPCSN